MSSIAYVTDESMLEYHRLCRNKSILFWRISSKKKFADFRKGDLLFFFARSQHNKKKGLVGYAHFDSVKRLSLKQMWQMYGQSTGYDNEALLKEAIEKAAKGDIPKQMSCLYLTDVVFFITSIYPEEVGIDIPKNLESYCYLDRNDPRVTVEILKKAAERGIDFWSLDSDANQEEIFERDEIRHYIAVIHREIGKEAGSEKERQQCYKLAKQRIENDEWEMIRGSRTDSIKVTKNTIIIGLPFVAHANDRDLRIRELIGRITMYRLLAKKANLERRLSFQLLGNAIPEEVLDLVETINHE
ncbi:MAG: hypothetical protein IJ875_00345 [Solobacterium sp.]|nr:hypothetical protein [Solobacterium sp.]